MHRRTYLASVAAGAAALAGCLDRGSDSADGSPTPGGTTAASGATTTTPSPTAADATAGYDLPYRLRIENRATRRVTIEVTLAELGDDGPPDGESVAESYTLDSGERVSLDEYVAPGVAYNVAVTIDGGASDDWNLYEYAALTVEIVSPTELSTTVVEV